MSGEAQQPAAQTAPVPPLVGLIILVLVVAIIVGWILLGSKLLGVTSFFATFLFLWYWASVEQADFKQWPQSVIGALFGLGLAWQSAYLPTHFGQGGLIAAIVILLAAVYVQIVNWVPLVCNRAAMLFLTVLAAPALLEKLDAIEAAKAIGLGAIFVGAVVKLATMATAKMGGGAAS